MNQSFSWIADRDQFFKVRSCVSEMLIFTLGVPVLHYKYTKYLDTLNKLGIERKYLCVSSEKRAA